MGAGEAGSLVAELALDAGRRVAMVYRAPYGSTCLNTGCVPSKFLIERAKIAHTVRTAARFGIGAQEPRVDLAAIVREKKARIDQHRAESLAAARDAGGLTLVEGPARFVDGRVVEVGGRRLAADLIFVATGLRPRIPDLPGLASTTYLTSETLMEEAAIPPRLVVLGGGYVACELGQAYARFGSRVAIVQSRPHLLPEEEPDISTALEKALREEGIELHLGVRATRVEQGRDGPHAFVEAAESERTVIEGSHLLMATGRRPNTDDLALGVAQVARDEKGFARVDNELATTAPGIWAIGDVNGRQPFTRVCQEEARVAAANALAGEHRHVERRTLGHAVFTDPEIASVGDTEAEAPSAGHDAAVGYVTFDQVERAELMGRSTGFIKYVVDRSSHRLLGCHVIGPSAAELIYDASLLMRLDAPLDDLGRTAGIFPTLQERMEGAARALLRRIAAAPTRATALS